ncbi:MAG: APC family permease [Candidatus Rokuibacteriota bacterium]
MSGGPRSAGLQRGLGLLPLAAIVFFNVSGGPYGIEDTVPQFGPGLTLLLLVLTPLVWSLPVTLVMAELASAMPDEGGYVTWTTRAFGPFWGFQVGWWSWLDSFVDVAVYPALFVEYARFWHPAMTSLERWGLALAFIVALTALNLAGVRPTGRAAVVLAALALAPIAALVVSGVVTLATGTGLVIPWHPFLAPSQTLPSGLGLGLAVVMWNYSGWDTPSTILGEARAPERAFRVALLVSLPAIAVAYVLPVAVALASADVPREAWQTGALPTLAAALGGPWLGHAVALGAVVSTAGLFLSLLLTNSRLPYVLARDGRLPRGFARVHPRFGTPWPAVLVSAAVYAGCAAFSFKELIVLNVWLYSLALLVELAAFLRLRRAEPGLARPWRVPGGTVGAVAVAVVPALLALLAMATAGWVNTAAGVVVASTGPLAWALAGSRR